MLPLWWMVKVGLVFKLLSFMRLRCDKWRSLTGRTSSPPDSNHLGISWAFHRIILSVQLFVVGWHWEWSSIWWSAMGWSCVGCRPLALVIDNFIGPSLLGDDLLWSKLCCLHLLHDDLHGGIHIAFNVYCGSILSSSSWVFGKTLGDELDCQANSGWIRGRLTRKQENITPCTLGLD